MGMMTLVHRVVSPVGAIFRGPSGERDRIPQVRQGALLPCMRPGSQSHRRHQPGGISCAVSSPWQGPAWKAATFRTVSCGVASRKRASHMNPAESEETGVAEDVKVATSQKSGSNLDPLYATLQGAVVATLLQGVVDPAVLLAAAVLGLTATFVEPKELSKLLKKVQSVGSTQAADTLPSQKQLDALLSKVEGIINESSSASRPVDAAQLQTAMRTALQNTGTLSPTASRSLARQVLGVGSQSFDKRLTGLLKQVTDAVGQGYNNIEGSLSAEKLQSALQSTINAGAETLKPVTQTLSPEQLPLLTALVRAAVRTLVAPGTTEGRLGNAERTALGLADEAWTLEDEWRDIMGQRAVPKKRAIYVPLQLSANLTDNKPLKVEVYGQPLVLFRPRPNEVAALPDACPHRGASLSMGSMTTPKPGEGRCVKCPYHGLEFNGSGSCGRPHIHTDSIKVVEANGVIWMEDEPISLGDMLEGVDEFDLKPFLRSFWESLGVEAPAQAAPAITPISAAYAPPIIEDEEEAAAWEAQNEDPQSALPFNQHFHVPGFRSLGGTVDIDAPPKAVVDNTFDLHHMFYVHGTTFGAGQLVRSWRPDPLTICFEYAMSSANPFTPYFGDGKVHVKMERCPPYSAMVTVGDSKGKVQLKTLTHVVPISATKTRLVWQLLRNFGTWALMDFAFRIAVKRILSEDIAVLEHVDLTGIKQGMDLGI